jgi:hypothetical protein
MHAGQTSVWNISAVACSHNTSTRHIIADILLPILLLGMPPL